MNAPPLHWIFPHPSSLLGSYTAKLEQMELDADERPSEEAYEKEKNLVQFAFTTALAAKWRKRFSIRSAVTS